MKTAGIIIFLIVLGVVVPKFFIADKIIGQVAPQNVRCALEESRRYIDTPLEKFLLSLGKLQFITNEDNVRFVLLARSLYGIPFAQIEVVNCEAIMRTN